MSAFLTRLAGIALGQPARGAARLSLPPRYAQPRASDAVFDAAQSEEPAAGPLLAPPVPSRPVPAAAPAHGPHEDARIPDAAPAPSAAAPAERHPSPDSPSR